MAKKPPPGLPLGCSLPLLALFGLGYASPYLVAFGLAAAVYCFPFFLGYLLLRSRWGRPPALEAVEDSQIARAAQDLQLSRDALAEKIASIKAAGHGEGIRYLNAESRFEMRSRRGQELNQELSQATSELNDIEARIRATRHPEAGRRHAWSKSYQAWQRGRSHRWALIAGSVCFLISAVGLRVFSYADILHRDLLVWNVAPQFIGRSIEIASVIGLALSVITLIAAKRFASRSPEQGDDLSETVFNDDDLLKQADRYGSDPSKKDPFSILEISSDASDAEVKSAYRLAISKCHPDTVANRSLGIQLAAEAEARLINAAYEEIRAQRGFT